MWYDDQPLLSHNKLVNMVLSNRGGGKTFRLTRRAIDQFKKKKKQTAWVRRYQTEIDEMILNGKFFDAVREYYPDDKLTIEGNLGIINGEVAIYFIALSTSRNLKSNNYPDVDLIVFDEFIIAKGKLNYLKDEVLIFLDLMETIFRSRDNGKAVLLANSITQVNPYFIFWDIKLKPKRFTVNGQVCVEMFTDTDFVEQKKKTKFGQLVSGTKYSDYAIDNKFLLDSADFIEAKSPKSCFELAIKYEGEIYGFWGDYEANRMYACKQHDPSSRNIYSLTMDDHSPNLMLIRNMRSSRAMQMIIFCFENALLRFSDIQVKGKVYEILSQFVR